jgi:glutathione S-transferase
VSSIDTATLMPATDPPVLYSFRRCPYAMRARLALTVSGQRCELREVVLRNKPPELIVASPKGTVPVLVESDGRVIDESLEIMRWALQRNDPDRWLLPSQGSLEAMHALIELIDTEFKAHLDRYKYPGRHGLVEGDSETHRTAAALILEDLNLRLSAGRYLFSDHPTLADMAIAPFIRQFAQVDVEWFGAQAWSRLQDWLSSIIDSALFLSIMKKYPPWIPGQSGVSFPEK